MVPRGCWNKEFRTLLCFLALGIYAISCPPEVCADESLAKGLVAYWNFDEGEGDICTDSSPNKLHAEVHGAKWVKGKYGYALQFDGDDFVARNNHPLLHVSGPLTLTAWIKPDIYGQQFVISKYGWSIYLGGPVGGPLQVYFGTRNSANNGWSKALASRVGVAVKAKWSFVAAVYDPTRQRQEIYIDGDLTNTQTRTEPIGGTKQTILTIGRYAASKSNWFRGLIDEVRIYKRALSSEDIGRLYRLDLSTAFRKIKLTVNNVFSKGKVWAEVNFRALKPLPKNAFIEVNLVRAGEKTPLRKIEIHSLPASGKARTDFTVGDLLPGEYEIEATLFGAKEAVAVARGKFMQAAKPSWLGSKEGISNEVLAPWTPIHVKKGESLTVETWGRSYEFSRRPLLSRIDTLNCSILSAPIRIVAKINGRPVEWQPRPVKLLRQTPSEVQISQRASGLGLVLTVRSEVEYDGLIKMNLSLGPKKAMRMDELVLEIPLSKKSAKNLYSHPYGLRTWFIYPGKLRPKALPERGSVVGYRPTVLWIGDERLGLAWMSESGLNWYTDKPDKATEIIVEDDRVLVRLHIIDTPIQLAPKENQAALKSGLPIMAPASRVPRLEYTFGLQATPVKPMAKTAWDYRIASCPWYGEDFSMLTRKIHGKVALDYLAEKGVRALMLLNWTKVFSYTRPIGHEDEMRRFIGAAHERGIKVIPYVGGFLMSELAPEWSYLRDEIAGLRHVPDPSARGYVGYSGDKQFVNRVCYNSVVQDFLVEGIAHLIDEYDIDGVYLDSTVYPSPCLNRLHGCGFIKPDGSRGYINPIFAIRDMLKRIYTVVKTRKPDGLIDVHVPSMNIAAMTWATSYWDGESLKKARGPILDAMPLDHFRIEFMGRQWGIPAELLQYTLFQNTLEGYKKAYAISLLHDVPVRAHGVLAYIQLSSRLWQLFDDFGRKEAEWLPYWNNSDYVSVEPGGVYVSLYKHPKNGVLIVASNLKEQEANAELILNLQKLDLPSPVTGIDGLTKESVSCEGNKISLTLPSLHWQVIWVRPRAEGK